MRPFRLFDAVETEEKTGRIPKEVMVNSNVSKRFKNGGKNPAWARVRAGIIAAVMAVSMIAVSYNTQAQEVRNPRKVSGTVLSKQTVSCISDADESRESQEQSKKKEDSDNIPEEKEPDDQDVTEDDTETGGPEETKDSDETESSGNFGRTEEGEEKTDIKSDRTSGSDSAGSDSGDCTAESGNNEDREGAENTDSKEDDSEHKEHEDTEQKKNGRENAGTGYGRGTESGETGDDSAGNIPENTSADMIEDQEQDGREVITDEEWMSDAEFETAFEKVTRGAEETLSYAKIVSKGSEIEYEELDIGEDVPGHLGHTTPVNIIDEDNNFYLGICVSPDDRGWRKGTVLPGVSRVTDSILIRLYYYTALNDFGESLARSRGFGDDSDQVAIAAMHEAMSIRYSELGGVEYDRPNVGENLRSLTNAYRSAIESKPVPDPGKVFVYISARIKDDGHWRQAYVFGREEDEESSSVVLIKVSSDEDMKAGFPAYSLHTASNGSPVNFRMYTDNGCTHKADVYSDSEMTKALDPIPVGLTSVKGLNNRTVFYTAPGTYYLKEINTPKGYQKHDEPFGPYTLEEGRGKTIKIANTPVYARAGIEKVDAENSRIKLAGAKFGLYSDIEDARNGEKPDGVFTTGENGKSNLLNVLAGKTYYVCEIEAPEGYKKSTGIRKLTVAEAVDQTVFTVIPNIPEKGKVRVEKKSTDPGADNSPYSLAGAVYKLYNKLGEEAGTLTTGKDGLSNTLTVSCGTYTLKEISPSPGFKVDVKTHNLKVYAEKTTIVESDEPPIPGKITIKKFSSEEKNGKEPDTIPIEGAEYTLYQTLDDAKQGRAEKGTFTIRADGTANVIEVLAGKNYYIKETRTPEGYLEDKEIHEVRVESLTETTCGSSVDQLIFGGVKIQKRDLETLKGKALGGARLDGAVFAIFNDGDFSVYAGKNKILPGKQAMTITTDQNGIARTNDHALSYGSYRIEEITPPEGYLKKGASVVHFEIREDKKIVDLTGDANTSISNQVMRGDFSIRKMDSYSQKHMEGVTFEITGMDCDGNPIETHRFTTDENGVFESTAAFAKMRKNRSKKDQSQDSSSVLNPEETGREEQSGRIWFGIDTAPDDSLGALPFGNYHIEEIEGDNNKGMKMFSEDFCVYSDKQIISLGNIENTLKPTLETELVDKDQDHFADKKGMVTLTDTVTFAGMEEYIGKEVVFRGVIYVKETGQPLRIGGKTIESEKVKKILSPAGIVKLVFTFDASKTKGMTLVCYEYASEKSDSLTEESGAENPADSYIAVHNDPDDEAQTIHLVEIETEAEDMLTGMHVANPAEGAVTVDHVTCRGLIPGTQYLVTGFLVDKTTGKPLFDKEGKKVTARASFTAETSQVIIDLTFTYDASLLEGKTVVAFEQLYLQGEGRPENPESPGEPEKPDFPEHPDEPDDLDEPDVPPTPPIAVHEDAEDEDQSIHYPCIRTTATGPDKESRTIDADGTVKVHDRVIWKNLVPGLTYKVRGTLMRKDTGAPFRPKGEEVNAETEFMPSEINGETEVIFSFDTSELKEKKELNNLSIVAFEKLYLIRTGDDIKISTPTDLESTASEELLVASHMDIDDEAQTVILREKEKPGKTDIPEKPEEPGKLKDPEPTKESDKPDRPKKKSSSGDSGGTSGKKYVKPASPQTARTVSGVKTGDDTQAVLLILSFIAALTAVTVVFVKKRKRPDQNK